MHFYRKAFFKPLLTLLLLVWVTQSSAHIHGLDTDHHAECSIVHFAGDDHTAFEPVLVSSTDFFAEQESFVYLPRGYVAVDQHFKPSRDPPSIF